MLTEMKADLAAPLDLIRGVRSLNLIYLKNPKVGCTSTSEWLHVLSGKEPLASIGQYHDQRLVDFATWQEIGDWCETATVFTAIRNPFDRVVSAYADKIESTENDPFVRQAFFRQHDLDPSKGISFLDFLKLIAAAPLPQELDAHWRPQFLNLCYPFIIPNFICRLESMSEDMQAFSEAASLPSQLEIGRLHSHVFDEESRIRRLAQYYEDSSETIDLVRQIYGDDFRYFAYPEDYRDGLKSGIRPKFHRHDHTRLHRLTSVLDQPAQDNGDSSPDMAPRLSQLVYYFGASSASARSAPGDAPLSSEELSRHIGLIYADQEKSAASETSETEREAALSWSIAQSVMEESEARQGGNRRLPRYDKSGQVTPLELELADVLEDTDIRLHAELLRARKIFERPFWALGRHMTARLHLALSRWKLLPERRRARSARSGEKRDPRQIYQELQLISEDLKARRSPVQIERFKRQVRLEGCDLTITAIVPNYNHAPYLAQRLDSILNQTYGNIDVLVLDDCSTDNSREIIDDYAARFPDRVRTLYNDENSGSVFAQWRKGCEAATGDLVWLCESDDFCELDFAEQLVGAFLDPSVMLAFGKIQFADAEGWELAGLDKYREDAEPGIWRRSQTRPACDWFSNGFAVSNVIANVGGSIWRRMEIAEAVWQEAQTYKITGDWYLYSEIAGGGQITYVPEAKSYFRMHDRNTSVLAQRSDGYYREYTKVMTSLKAQWPVPDATLDRFVDGARSVYDARPKGTKLAPFDSLIDREALRALPRTRPHVLIVFLGFSYGGGEIFPINLANALHARGERVSMLQLYKGDDHDDVRGMLDPAIAVYDAEEVSRQGVDEFLHAAGISVIHSHIVSAEMFFFETHRTQTRLPYIVTLHGSYEAMKATKGQIATYGKHVTHWNYTADRNLEPIRPLAIPPARLHKMRNAMPVDPRPYGQTRAEMGIGEDALVFTLIARGVQRKGWRVAVEAFRQLAEAHPEREMHLLLVGEGEATDRVREAAERMPNVHLLGYRTEIHGLFRLSDVALAPTRFAGESFPLVLIQAMQTGTPIVTSDVGQIPQMLRSESGEAGILVPAKRDTAAFTEATRAAMEQMLDDATRAEHARHAKEIGARFSMAEIAEEYARQYRQSIADLGTA